MPIIYDSFETCEISVNLIGVLDYLICIPRPLAWGVFRSKTLQRYNKSLKYTNYSAFFCIFATHRTFGDYVSPVGPQYDKERLSTILHCKSTIKKRKAQRF